MKICPESPPDQGGVSAETDAGGGECHGQLELG